MNSNNYNSLVKLAAPITPGSAAHLELVKRLNELNISKQNFDKHFNLASRARNTAPGSADATMQAPTLSKPKTYPAVNPATGGTRISYKSTRPIGPVETDSSIRRGPLPIVPYSSGKLPLRSMHDARQLAEMVNEARHLNDKRKLEVALNFDAMFKNLHETNQQRIAAGLPLYTPQALDVYAPYALSKTDYADAENRLYNDIHLSTIAHEAARRGTPLNEAEINEVSAWMPRTDLQRRERRDAQPSADDNMGLRLPGDVPNPYEMGEMANGIWPH